MNLNNVNKENKSMLFIILIFCALVAYFYGIDAYEMMDVKKNGSVATCKVVYEPHWWLQNDTYVVLLNGEGVDLCGARFSDYKENDEVEVLWKKGHDVVIPKDCSNLSIVLPTLVVTLVIAILLFCLVSKNVRFMKRGVVNVFIVYALVLCMGLNFAVKAYSAFDLKNTGSVATAKVVNDPGFFSKSDYRVLVNGVEIRLTKGVLGSYDENEEFEVYWKKYYNVVVPKDYVVSTIISYGLASIFMALPCIVIGFMGISYSITGVVKRARIRNA